MLLQRPKNTTTLTTLAQHCKTLNHLKQLHAHILKTNTNPLSLNALFSIATKSQAFFSYASSLFSLTTLHQRNTFTYNTFIKGTPSPKRAVLCYLQMLQDSAFSEDVGVNKFTFPPLVKACADLGSGFEVFGRLVHAHVVKFGFWDDPFVGSSLIGFYGGAFDVRSARMVFDRCSARDGVMWTALVDAYGKVGEVRAARELFGMVPDRERDVVTWSALMAGYSKVSEFKEVIGLFEEMQEVGVEPNESVLVSVLTACAHLGAVTQGMWVHGYARQQGWVSNPILATALVDMYSKCGYVDLALRVFDAIPVKDAGAWNAMISGFALNGDVKMSFKLFDEMVISGTQPTEASFVSVLAACTHARMVGDGIELYKKMESVYGVKPQLEHQACVVDLLARAGRLEEAEKFIEDEMGGLERGDSNVWGALLNACRVYGNVEIVNRFWGKLVDMGVTHSGTHVLSYNIFKEAGWEAEANKVRKFISDTGIKKKPGCSVVEVNGVAEEFHAGNLCHPWSREICNMVYSLSNMENLEEISYA